VIELEERDDVVPLCPHCGGQIRKLAFQELRGFAGRRYAYFCPDCRKVLGVSHRKGFFMG